MPCTGLILKAQPTGQYIIFKPFDELTEEDAPVIYFVFAKPDVISALHALASFDDTRVDNVIVPFGSGCEGLLSFALDEARKENPRVVLGGMDPAMRVYQAGIANIFYADRALYPNGREYGRFIFGNVYLGRSKKTGGKAVARNFQRYTININGPHE